MICDMFPLDEYKWPYHDIMRSKWRCSLTMVEEVILFEALTNSEFMLPEKTKKEFERWHDCKYENMIVRGINRLIPRRLGSPYSDDIFIQVFFHRNIH